MVLTVAMADTLTLAEATANLAAAKAAYARALAEPASYSIGDISLSHQSLDALAAEVARWQRAVVDLAAPSTRTNSMRIGQWNG